MTTIAEYTILLRDARAQYHKLITGQAAKVFVDQNGERVEYATASIPRLLAYISQLEMIIAGGTATPGPLNVWM